MSAFTPYKRQIKVEGNEDYSQTPVNLIFNLTRRHENIYDIRYFDVGEKKIEEPKKMRGFLMKNILGEEEEEVGRKKEAAVEAVLGDIEEQVREEALVTRLGEPGLGHRCVYCGKVYSRKYGLKIHIRTHTGYKPLKCKVCLRPFGDPSNLNKHVRLHARGQTPYRCEVCGKILVRRRDLDRHMKSRHPTTSS